MITTNLPFAQWDRKRWMDWLFEAKKHFNLSVLNYMVTSNHVHHLVYDNNGPDVIPKSMQLIAPEPRRNTTSERKERAPFGKIAIMLLLSKKIPIYSSERQSDWSQSIAVGNQSFIEKVKNRLGFKAKGKTITSNDDHYQLRENISDFGHVCR